MNQILNWKFLHYVLVRNEFNAIRFVSKLFLVLWVISCPDTLSECFVHVEILINLWTSLGDTLKSHLIRLCFHFIHWNGIFRILTNVPISQVEKYWGLWADSPYLYCPLNYISKWVPIIDSNTDDENVSLRILHLAINLQIFRSTRIMYL